MRKGILLLLSIFIIVLSSCSTMVGVSYLNPSNVEMGSYRNIAIASTVPYKGKMIYPRRIRNLDQFSSWIDLSPSYTRSIVQNVADYATSSIVSNLTDTGYYNVLPPAKTDQYINLGSIGYSTSKELMKAGYDAVMIPRIENMDIDEYIWSSLDGYRTDIKGNRFPVYEFYIKRVVSITLTITVVDCRTDRIIARKSYSDSSSWSDDFSPDSPHFSRDAYYMLKSMINGLRYRILNDFVPSLVVEDIALMQNKPKLESAKGAYAAVKDGDLDSAYNMFLSLWNSDRHVPSGYNAALLNSSFGNYDGALSLLSDIQRMSDSSDVRALYYRLSEMKKKNILAESQIDSTIAADDSSVSQEISIYQYLTN